MSLTSDMFEDLMARSFGDALDGVDALAVGVSGGADSMALLWLLQGWCVVRGKDLHVLSVDHGLREAAAGECAAVAAYCEAFDHVTHEILMWEAPSDVRVQEDARAARYKLMGEYCSGHDIMHLFLAHHEDDQAETVLFRLAKGSGLDGLAGMRAMQPYEGIQLCRPLLRVGRADLVGLCETEGIPYVDDPSNEDVAYARVRLRQSMDVLSDEGLTPKRLSVTAKRLARARDALDEIAVKSYESKVISMNTNRIEFKIDLCGECDEILIRVLLKAISEIGSDRDYAPRMEKVEDLAYALQNDLSFRKRTLGGVIFERDDDGGRVILVCENPQD